MPTSGENDIEALLRASVALAELLKRDRGSLVLALLWRVDAIGWDLAINALWTDDDTIKYVADLVPTCFSPEQVITLSHIVVIDPIPHMVIAFGSNEVMGWVRVLDVMIGSQHIREGYVYYG